MCELGVSGAVDSLDLEEAVEPAADALAAVAVRVNEQAAVGKLEELELEGALFHPVGQVLDLLNVVDAQGGVDGLALDGPVAQADLFESSVAVNVVTDALRVGLGAAHALDDLRLGIVLIWVNFILPWLCAGNATEESERQRAGCGEDSQLAVHVCENHAVLQSLCRANAPLR